MMDLALDRLQRENKMLWEEIWDMWEENTEDWRGFLKEVGEVQKDMRMMEG